MANRLDLKEGKNVNEPKTDIYRIAAKQVFSQVRFEIIQ